MFLSVRIKMKINEIFYSLQGEGIWTGLPNVFIRITGCNLRCSFCDTKYAYYEGEEMEIKQIINKISKYNCKFICLTGGEPLIQDETLDLIKALVLKNYEIYLETNGSIDIKNIINISNLIISLDIKCPSSNMQGNNYLDNIDLLKKKDQLKFVIKDNEDYEYAKKIINKYKPKCLIYFQSVWGIRPDILARKILKDKINVRLGIQLHKILWGDKRGT